MARYSKSRQEYGRMAVTEHRIDGETVLKITEADVTIVSGPSLRNPMAIRSEKLAGLLNGLMEEVGRRIDRADSKKGRGRA